MYDSQQKKKVIMYFPHTDRLYKNMYAQVIVSHPKTETGFYNDFDKNSLEIIQHSKDAK